MMLLAQFMVLLATHWVADFVLQTHWQASNKSKNNEALTRHVATYAICLGFVAAAMFPTGLQALVFTWINAALHWVTDYLTSRWSSRLFASAAGKVYSDDGRVNWTHFGPHNFFAVIGLDQLIHQTTLAVTLYVVMSWRF